MNNAHCHFKQAKSFDGYSRTKEGCEKSFIQKNDNIHLLLSNDYRSITNVLSELKNMSVKFVRGDWRKAIFIPILFLLFKCSMKSDDVRRGEYLDNAKEITVEDFFEKRMKNRIKKVQGANWEILFESGDFIYFGYPLIKLFREGTFLEEFFKVDRFKLEADFPSYKKFDGINMKSRCFELLGEKIQNNIGGLSHSFECSATLEEKSILVLGKIFFRQKDGYVKMEKYLIRFDKATLNRESITKLDN